MDTVEISICIFLFTMVGLHSQFILYYYRSFSLGDERNDYLAPQWYDLALILSFAWNGCCWVFYRQANEKITEKFFPGRPRLFF